MDTYTVLIPVYNQHFELQMLLECLTKQTVQPESIIVVDDGTDIARERLQAICREYRNYFGNLDYISIGIHGAKWFTKSQAYNEGIGYVQTPYVSIIDADSLLMPDYHERCLEALEDVPSAITVPIRVEPAPNKDSHNKDIKNLLESWHTGSWSHCTNWVLGNSRSNNWSYRKNYHSAHLGSTQGCNVMKTDRAQKVRWSDIMGWGGEDEDFLLRCVIDGGVILYFHDIEVAHTCPYESSTILRWGKEKRTENREELMPKFNRRVNQWEKKLVLLNESLDISSGSR